MTWYLRFYTNTYIVLLIKLLMQVTLLLLPVTINYGIILLMLFITSWYKLWYVLCHLTKAFFCQINTLVNLYIYGIHHWRILRSSYRKLAWVGFELTTTEFRSDALTDWATRPWVQLALRTNFNIQYDAVLL